MAPPDVWTEARRAAARATAARFAGTPHVNRLCLPGEGVDCVHFVQAVLDAAGLLDHHPLPFYHEALGCLRRTNVIEWILVAYLHARAEVPNEPRFGDVVVCKCGRQSNHVGIIIDGAFWHVPARGRCGPEAWASWAPRAQCLVRIDAPGYKVEPASLTWEAIRAMAEASDRTPCPTTPGSITPSAPSSASSSGSPPGA